MAAHLETLTGSLDRFVFKNEESGFAVALLTTADSMSVTICGSMAGIHAGQSVQLHGTWVIHPKFGRQFEATSCVATAPTSIAAVEKYLSSGFIHGIGPHYAKKMVAHFGKDILAIIDTDPARLAAIPGMGKKRIDAIGHAWKQQREIAAIMVFLQDKGVSSSYATKIYKKYRSDTLAILQSNPYQLAQDIWGIGFKIADQIAQKMGIAADSLQRAKAGVIHLIAQHVGNGDLYIEVNALKQKTAELLGIALDTAMVINEALRELHRTEKTKLVQQGTSHFLTLASYYFSEKGVATKIISIRNRRTAALSTSATRTIEDIALNEEQQHAIQKSLLHAISIVTGGPGTGKTTIISTLLRLLEKEKITYHVAAPTGRAAKRITEATGRPAYTIHRLLEFNFATHTFEKNEHSPLKTHFLVIDEASMIDIFLAHAVLRALPTNAHILFLGDVDQLPSVGAGNFLRDLIDSETIACTRLTQIFRQTSDSLIVTNAHRINNGEFPIRPSAGTQSDFLFVKEEDPAALPRHLKTIMEKTLRSFGLSPSDAMTLTPMHRTVTGAQQINSYLQQLLNPLATDRSLSYNGTLFKTGDRVMQLKNNYEKGVFNGDMGVVTSVDKSENCLTVAYPEQSLSYGVTELDELSLAYAITIHKSQGSEYPAVIIPLFMQHYTMLKKNLIYTAVTRAKKLCILIGQPRALAIAIKSGVNSQRLTFLKEFLKTELP